MTVQYILRVVLSRGTWAAFGQRELFDSANILDIILLFWKDDFKYTTISKLFELSHSCGCPNGA